MRDFLVRHAAEAAEQEHLTERLRKAQHNVLKEQGCILCSRLAE